MRKRETYKRRIDTVAQLFDPNPELMRLLVKSHVKSSPILMTVEGKMFEVYIEKLECLDMSMFVSLIASGAPENV